MGGKVNREVLLGFVEEAMGYLPTILDCLETFKKDHSQLSVLEEAHRLFHIIKGAGSMVGLTQLSHVAYFAEEVLEDIAAGQLPFNQQTVTTLLFTVSQMESYLDLLVSEAVPDNNVLVAAVKKFRRLKGLPEAEDDAAIAKLAIPATPITSAPTAPPPSASKTALPDDLTRELLEIFSQEAEDHLNSIARLLRELEERPYEKGLLLELRRSVHTLKGAAGTCGFKVVSQLAHRMEDLLDHLYDNDVALSAPMLNLCFTTADVLGELVQHSNEDKGEELAKLYAEYARLLEDLTPTSTVAEKSNYADFEPLGEEAIINLAPLMAKGTGFGTTVDQSASVQATPTQIVRVPIERLDELVRLVSELIVSRSTFEQYYRDLIREISELKLSVSRMQRIVGRLESEYEASTLGGGVFSMSPIARVEGVGAYALRFGSVHGFDELEFDRYTEFHLLARELNETTSDINALGGELNNTVGDFDSYLVEMGRTTSEVQDKLMRLRMVPLATITSRLHRIVRVTATEQNKDVRFVIEGENAELDKKVLEDLADPLLHLLRNAVDHGIEPPALRQGLGKERRGEIRLRAFYEATQIVIQINDDGTGIDPQMVRAAAVRGGHISEMEAANLSDEEIYSLVFLPGFSTTTEVSEISGRGVGLDIVKAVVNKMKGTISVHSIANKGTTFTIRLPMTLAIARVILVRAYNEVFAVPLAAVTRIVRIDREEIEYLGQQPVIRVEGVVYPAISLGEALNLKQSADDVGHKLPVLILYAGEEQIALVTDQIVEAREVVVKSMGNLLQRVPAVAGATLMGDGSVVLILNPAELIQPVQQREVVEPLIKSLAEQTHKVLQVLVVDDSVSVRRVISNLVRSVGWNPIMARDGLEALELIQNSAKAPDVILLDIEMPRMDGYELTTTLRANRAYKDIPIVMLTSRAGEKHRQKAMDLGVTEYLVKPYQEDVLLNVVRRVTRYGRGTV